MNLIFTGPCGVGKSTVAKTTAQKMGFVYIDFDEYRGTNMGITSNGYHPCSVSHLDFAACLYTKLDSISTGFILDIGGDTVFQSGVDNEDRKDQIWRLKTKYSARIILLTSERGMLFQRFSSSNKRSYKSISHLEADFNILWNDWLSIGMPYWSSCADIVVNTTSMSILDTINQISEELT